VYQVPEGGGASAGKRKKEEKIKRSNEGSAMGIPLQVNKMRLSDRLYGSNAYSAANKQDEVVRSIYGQTKLQLALQVPDASPLNNEHINLLKTSGKTFNSTSW
jgi:hypothetical protein